jgi:hypothetical protein
MPSKFLVYHNEYLLTCPQCASHYLELYHKISDCVRCESCGYFNTLINWNDGLDKKGWDNRILIRIRFLERRCNLNIPADFVDDRRIKND